MTDEPSSGPLTPPPIPPAPPEPARPFRWTERRAARLVTMLVSGVVVLADVYLLVVVLGMDPTTFAGWKPMILVGIAAIFLFAMYRFRRQLRLFREDQ